MSNEFTLNIPFLIHILFKWKLKIFLFLISLLIISAIILKLIPNRYYAYATAISTNSQLNDKSAVYNNNLDELHNSLGSWTDLERLYATCELDTSYKFLIIKYNLPEYYKIYDDDYNKRIQKTLKLLRTENMNIEKTESGLLRIHVWDKNAQRAADMANDFIEHIELKNRALQKHYNQNILQKIQEDLFEKSSLFKKIVSSNKLISDPADMQLQNIKQAALLEEINQLEKMAHQYELILKSQQASLIIIDKAEPNHKHESPKRLYLLFTIFLSGLLFSIFIVTLIESFNLYQKNNVR